MLDKLYPILEHYNEISEKLNDIEIVSDQNKLKALMKEQKSLTPLVEKINEYKSALDGAEEARELLSGKLDRDFKEMVQEELGELSERIPKIEEELKLGWMIG